MPESIEEAIAQLAHWSVVVTPPSGDRKGAQELTRRLTFASFAQAVAFMQAAVPQINAFDHHPRWENVYDTVTIWLCTHDKGNTVTKSDVKLAQYLDELYGRDFAAES